mmetsp:Transcript_65513/g.213317  ORF Transcript_65513/g.213317 Transcript_65513/m.213317 type:complete len:483 (+) Transcript_65513:64-1512(+)|eukprot:CAMPEP_0203879936 /NCGR_PEP_ID=MMETSP0359-20131031/24354_1 /ASSEMBLY_ACC=CAM_ASM_000338 /TAXON_ID=268821 /ORGANISM="Scrippsiella Hangoei, Strain SHTV-5" /LENGTH=482 /DNA_ID=CAMNT_0050799453 /DNA_START=36 /DNA_END=1484 /DNA_ORIENTATION=+
MAGCRDWTVVVASLLVLQRPSGLTAGAADEDAQCSSTSAPGCREGFSSSWRPLHSLGASNVALAELLGCGDAARAQDLATYCRVTRPVQAAEVCGFGRSFEEWLGSQRGQGGSGSPGDEAGCWRRCLFGTPDLHPFGVAPAADANAGLHINFVPLPREGYRSAPFLDGRTRAHGVEACTYQLPSALLEEWASAEQADSKADAAGGRRAPGFIFHLSHTASTLLARALGEVPGTLVLREPFMVRWMATSLAGARGQASVLQGVWRSPLLPVLSRRYHDSETVIVKTSSVALRFMRSALEATSGARAVFMYSGLRTHLAVCLARPKDLFPGDLYDGLGVKSKLFETYKAGSDAFQGLSIAERMVLLWMKRMLFVLGLAKAREEQVLLLRMDDFLEKPSRRLVDVAEFFGLPLSSKVADTITEGRTFKEYAKDSSVPWNGTIQATLLQGRAEAFADDIAKGLAFADKLLAEHGGVAKRLKAFIDQ